MYHLGETGTGHSVSKMAFQSHICYLASGWLFLPPISPSLSLPPLSFPPPCPFYLHALSFSQLGDLREERLPYMAAAYPEQTS